MLKKITLLIPVFRFRAESREQNRKNARKRICSTILHVTTIYSNNIYSPSTTTMNIAKSALALALASSARAFSPTARGVARTGRVFSPAVGSSSSCTIIGVKTFSSTTALQANVLKLTEPAKDLLPGVDVFIFDCDGVIWRVSVYQVGFCCF